MSDRPGKESTSAPTVATDVTRQELPYRLRQQSLLGEFGRTALQTRDIGQILQRATELCAQGLDTRFAKVLEYLPDDDRLLVRAGVGWEPGIVGRVSLGLDLESPAGYAFRTGQMVISNHLQEETRFRTPKLLTDHGIRRAINVLIARGGEGHLPFGVLEVDSPEPGQFDLADADFLAGFAGLLGIAIERQHADADLQQALHHQAMLTREMSHRVKNSLASVVGLLRVQSRGTPSEEVRNALKDAASRITTIAQVHDHLWRSDKIGFVDIADFAGELCGKLQETISHKVVCSFGHLMISADKAIPLGLLINELVTNSAKHAYPDGSGEIQVSGERRGADLHVEVSDRGIGLPKDFDIDEPRASLGFKVIKSLIAQLGGRMAVASNTPKGLSVQLDMPLETTTVA
jgi:two-component system, sensor histidine kinase PdtaS